jgi:hypothetical protein
LINLYEYTFVIVVSRKRMWLSHFWENPSFAFPENYQFQIYDAIEFGGGGVPQGVSAFTGPGGDFGNTTEVNLRDFFVTPSLQNLLYPDVVRKIWDHLKRVVGQKSGVETGQLQ